MTYQVDAVKMWCPFARELGDEGASYNRNYNGDAATKCIGDRCMAWRWHPEPEWKEFDTEAEAKEEMGKHREDEAHEHGDMGDGGPWLVSVGPAGGFCGMAGREGAR